MSPYAHIDGYAERLEELARRNSGTAGIFTWARSEDHVRFESVDPVEWVLDVPLPSILCYLASEPWNTWLFGGGPFPEDMLLRSPPADLVGHTAVVESPVPPDWVESVTVWVPQRVNGISVSSDLKHWAAGRAILAAEFMGLRKNGDLMRVIHEAAHPSTRTPDEDHDE
jgi:hypothetical protein